MITLTIKPVGRGNWKLSYLNVNDFIAVGERFELAGRYYVVVSVK